MWPISRTSQLERTLPTKKTKSPCTHSLFCWKTRNRMNSMLLMREPFSIGSTVSTLYFVSFCLFSYFQILKSNPYYQNGLIYLTYCIRGAFKIILFILGRNMSSANASKDVDLLVNLELKLRLLDTEGVPIPQKPPPIPPLPQNFDFTYQVV